MWMKHSFFKYITGLILILICIYFLEKLHFFNPIQTIVNTLFFPIIIAGFLFYILRPVVRVLSSQKYIPPAVAILLVFAAIIGAGYLGFNLLADTIEQQAYKLSKIPDQIKSTAEQTKEQIERNDMGIISSDALIGKATKVFSEITNMIENNLADILSALTGMTTVIIIVPFVLFYFLKDGHRLIPFLVKVIPQKHKGEGRKILTKIDETLSAYIIGQITIAVVDGILVYVGYLIIGLDYALLLAIFVVITAVIPFFGPIIGTIPSLVAGLMQDPMMGLYVVLIMVIVQQIEGSLVAPVVLGNKLKVHPLTIIFLLIVAGALKGFIGMVIAVPLYSVLKVIVVNLYQFYKLRTL
ncbi:AI-2E family transporter [Halobacillus salinarum]|uniref:AI-2E family transporter n=1 Tax=Halobacillus salinarum TaxID=2932257 RepID=A0ABY4EHP0_9BACI|nr:AI-2E family transporter [Halobacillus salinarum]UOQ43988.1 AI-2E family transporter [Halobacillus salinarum]